jgi:hypothetical protein
MPVVTVGVMIGNLPISELVPVDGLHLEAFPGRGYTDEEPAVHGQVARSEVSTAARAPYDDVVSLRHEIEDLESKVGEGLLDVVEDTAGAFPPNRPAVVPGVLCEVLDGSIDGAPVQALVMCSDHGTVLS